MANGETSERVILQLRAVLRGISPLIWRRLLVPSDTTIAQLHEAPPSRLSPYSRPRTSKRCRCMSSQPKATCLSSTSPR